MRTRLGFYIFCAAFLFSIVENLFPAYAQAQTAPIYHLEFPVRRGISSSEAVFVRVIIVDVFGNTLWSNDGSSAASSEPLTAFQSRTNAGILRLGLGGNGTLPLPANIFDGQEERLAVVWLVPVRRPRNRPQLYFLPVNTVARAINADRLGGRPASDYLLGGGGIPPGSIQSSQLAAFSNNGNSFTIGDGTNTGSKQILVDTANPLDPALRYNTTTSQWEFSNDGSSFFNFGSSAIFVGTGSTTNAVDLDTAETQGILPITKGGTGAGTAAGARVNLGLQIGTDVAAFVLNNLAAAAGPTIGDDSSLGYQVGSRWVDILLDEEYVALDVTPGAAVWKSTTTADTANIADGSITNIKIANDAVTSSKILDGTIVGSDLATNTITNNEIGIDAVGASELASTSVVPGTYTLGSFTVDEDGRLTAASSGAELGDISAVGNALTGDAFTDDNINGSELVYEGTTVDGNETRLVFSGDPIVDSLVTIPNITGTLITSGDTGTVLNTMIANDAVTTGKILDGTIAAGDLATDTLTSNEIAADAITASELAATTVVPGLYTMGSFTVDQDGRLLSATSNTETGDISAVGDALTGDAFTDDNVNGTEFVYEGTTVDGNETRLVFTGDPIVDSLVTIPNITGTLITTGDTGTVSNTMLANDSVTTGKILNGTILGGDLANDTLTANEIAADAITASELAATTVVPGVYTLGSFIVDQDGRLVSATSGTEVGDISSVGDALSGDAFTDGTNNGSELVFEGTTIDGNETRLAFTGDPLVDSLVTIPNITGTLITTGDTGTVSNTMLANDSVTTGKILNGTILGGDLANDTLTANEVAADAITASELAATTVVPGLYTLGSFTVDQDGRLVSATSGTEVGDISSVGDALSGDAFTDGTSNGSELVFEGTTIDGNETRLAFTGDPLVDSLVTIPNITGTLITTSDTGTVSNTMLANDSVTTGKILNGTILGGDLATDTLTSNEIAADAITSSELAATTVVPGAYTFGSFTVDQDGRLTSATSNAEVGDISAVGDALTGDAFTDGMNNGTELVFEGSTIDTNETRLVFTGDPIVDSLVTIPNITGTLITTGDTGTVSNTMLANDSVTTGKILNSTILGGDLASDTLTSNEIAADAITASELAATTVVPGVYTFGSFTVDQDGRLTSATSNAEVGDISSVGDALSGDAFTDGTNNGTELVYEGTTIDGNETRLAFTGDPFVDSLVTIPNITGTLITTGDTGTVSNTMLANDSVTTGKILNSTILGGDLASDTLTSNEIAADAITASELAATTVVPGVYTFGSFTVDQDGRLTSATSNAEVGDISSVGDALSGDAFTDGTNNGTELVYEGTTIDGNETRLAFTGDPLVDSLVTIPNITGTLITTGDSGTVSNTMLANDSVTTGKILNGTILAGDLATDTLTSNEIAADAITASELAATTVVPGVYTFGSFTVDQDGRLLSATSNAEVGDISSVGDALTGDAFTDGTNNGTELVYEGPTVDTSETRLVFNGDPIVDSLVTIPNITGTLITTGDTGTVSNTMLANDSVTTGKILNGTILGGDLATDTLTSNEIAANAITASELASTTVVPGVYTLGSFTVDQDGRLTSATSNAEVGDISSVGDALSGDAFTDDNVNGTEFVYEGTTVDTNETRLVFSGDPIVDSLVTIPNITGTLITTGDTGTVSNTMLANDSVTTGKILNGTILGGDLATDTLTSNEIAADAITASELASTTVVPGVYTLGSFTVDQDGRLTSATSNAEVGDISSVGDALSGDAFTDGTNNGSELVFEGPTIDGNETRLTFTGDPLVDSLVTIPNITGTLITTGDTGTVSNTMLANDSVTTGKILNGTILAGDLATDTLTSNEIAADSITASELASTTVVPGVYTFGSFTVDQDGRLVSATSNAEVGDISSVGNALTGDAFTDGTNNGTELVYEGTTIDGNETRITFTGDPLVDSLVTIPNITGTLITTGDTGTVSNTMLANDSVTTGKILNGTIVAADLLADTLTSNEIGPDAVSSSELASTAVTPGAFTLSNITVDQDGRITAASSGTETGDISAVGNALTGDAFTDGANNGTELVYEGASVDTNETRLAFSGDPSADTTVTIPNTTGTLITTGDTGTISSAMLGTGSVTSTSILNGTILDADINAAAGIAFSKLASLTSGSVLLGDGSNIPTATALSGDVTVNSTGVTTIQTDAVDGTNIALSGEASGDVMYFNGTNWIRLAAGTAGRVLTTNGAGNAPAWGTASAVAVPNPVLNRRLGYGLILQPTSTAFTGVGMNAATTVGTATASPQTDLMYLNYASAAAINSQAGHALSAVQTRGNWGPKYTAIVRTEAAVTNRRIWAGLTSATMPAIQVNTASTASAVSFAAIGYDTTGVGDNTNFVCCSGNGVNYSCTTTGVAVAASTVYTLTVDWSTAGTLVCSVNGTSVSRSTLLPALTTNLAIYNASTRLTAAGALNYLIARYSLEQN